VVIPVKGSGWLVLGIAAAALGGVAACQDAEHDNDVAALGPEAPGVSPGPTHRPGQPCLVCHGGIGPAKLQFSVAGTVYANRFDTSTPQQNALVELQDATGFYWHVTTNSVGNFFVLHSDWSPTFPIIVPQVKDPVTNQSQAMITLDNREGSCAACHGTTAGTDSVGPVYVYKTASADGG